MSIHPNVFMTANYNQRGSSLQCEQVARSDLGRRTGTDADPAERALSFRATSAIASSIIWQRCVPKHRAR